VYKLIKCYHAVLKEYYYFPKDELSGMGESVFYHLPSDKRFSMSFANPELDAVESRAVEKYSDSETRIEKYELDETIYVLYTASPKLGAAEELDYNFETEIEKMEPYTQTLTIRLLGLFRTILDQTFEEEAERLQAYKQVEIGDIPEALSYVGWSGTVPEVGGSLLSNLILQHMLPNANHRTSLALLELYIQSHEYGFDLPEMATEEFRWQTWVNNYIRISKRILTVRRNNKKFHYLWESGCDTIQRKDGIRIHLSEYSLDMPKHESYEYYAAKHNDLCVELTREMLRREGYPDLKEDPGMGKAQFAKRLEEMP